MANSKTLLIFTNTPTNTAELQTMCDDARRHYHAQADAIAVIQASLRADLSKLPGSPVLFGMDSRAVARRITKHLGLAAELNGQAARSFIACYRTYQEYILNTREAAKSGFTV